jgi:hypothetical protein
VRSMENAVSQLYVCSSNYRSEFSVLMLLSFPFLEVSGKSVDLNIDSHVDWLIATVENEKS